jgi:hypothetical protein
MPFFLYGPKGTHRIAADEAERERALAEGFWVWDKMNPTRSLSVELSSPSDTATPEPVAPVPEPAKKRGRPKKTQEQT